MTWVELVVSKYNTSSEELIAGSDRIYYNDTSIYNNCLVDENSDWVLLTAKIITVETYEIYGYIAMDWSSKYICIGFYHNNHFIDI